MSLVRVVEDKTQKRPYPNGNGRGSRAMRSFYSNSRVHVFEQGETILENLVNRRERPSKRYKAVVLAQHPELEGRIRWSQTAGCGCGCSPGFIVDHTVRVEGTPADIYITITADPIVQEPVEDTSYVEMALA